LLGIDALEQQRLVIVGEPDRDDDRACRRLEHLTVPHAGERVRDEGQDVAAQGGPLDASAAPGKSAVVVLPAERVA
jgi:hypothetical protein